MAKSDRKLVLIVDDTPTNVSVIAGLLKDSYKTKVATNGEKALAIAAGTERPALILLDVMMPGMDGYEVCRRLKANPATAEIPVCTENLVRGARFPVMKQVIPARQDTERAIQRIEMLRLSAGISRCSRCFLAESPCISYFSRERRVGIRLAAQPRSPSSIGNK